MKAIVQTVGLIGLEKPCAISPQMVICEHHTAGSVYKVEIPYMVSGYVYKENVRDVQLLQQT